MERNTIDLHGVKHEDVGSLLDTFLWEHMQRKSPCIRIITGNSPEMKRIVNELLDEYGFSSEGDYFNSGVTNVNLI